MPTYPTPYEQMSRAAVQVADAIYETLAERGVARIAIADIPDGVSDELVLEHKRRDMLTAGSIAQAVATLGLRDGWTLQTTFPVLVPSADGTRPSFGWAIFRTDAEVPA